MSNRPITCIAAGCTRLVKVAIPLNSDMQFTSTTHFNAKNYCCMSYAQHAVSNIISCAGKNCKRMVRNAIPIPPGTRASKIEFNVREYCSKTCFWLSEDDIDDDEDTLAEASPTTPRMVCDVCAIEKPLTAFVQSTTDLDTYSGRTSFRIPPDCKYYIVPHFSCMTEGVCIKCIKRHILIQFRDRGPAKITCILPHNNQCWPEGAWQLYAYDFLPKKLHKAYERRSFAAWWNDADQWSCPGGCRTAEITLAPKETPWYPHVECAECCGRFCAQCRVEWHIGLACQQYRAQNPEKLTEEERMLLKEMADSKARHCPQCLWIIVKDGGCPHMYCEQCDHEFDWRTASKVLAPRIGYNEETAGATQQKYELTGDDINEDDGD